MYFAYNSDNDYNNANQWSRGLTNPSSSPPYPPRYLNAYGQDKWKAIGYINEKIKNLEPALVSFDNTNRKSYILRSDYSNLYSQTYFSEVVTYRPFGGPPTCPEENPNSSVAGTYFECKDKRYLQVSTFQNSEPNTKYFMIVNRRCSPFIDATSDDNNGGRRFVKIKLDSGSSSFEGFNNWSIYNIENDSLIKTFDKRTISTTDLDWFLPGEGKLYKISPVMQEGGTLVADESVNGIQFICKGMVINNGKNISIGSGTNISFQTGAGINMTGGNFICDGSSGSDYIKLVGYSEQHWNGINLINTGNFTKIEKTTFENTKSPIVIYNSNFSAQYEQKIIRRNIFKVSQDSGTAVRINNQFALSIDSNTFDVTNYNNTSGIYLSNYSDEPGVAGYIPEDVYAVNITNNTFKGAYFPV